jgi:A/G-specific adenine glycosylase
VSSDADVTAALGDWYRANARVLPWRSDPTPYRVLLSELMLQQTRVETVLPYFARFLARWPTLAALAAADEADVLEEWAGLGYYARARNLHRCAQAAGEALPATAAALAELPGIGPYTAGAIASIAFGEAVPLVDGNVERVLSRLDACPHDVRSPAGKRVLWARATALQQARGPLAPGALNQALMELGATLCAPVRPKCGACPLRTSCAAAAAGTPESWPIKARKSPPRPVRGVAGLLRTDEGALLGRRVPGGLLGGLWEPVRVDLEDGPPETALETAFRALGMRVRIGARRGEVVHVFTHRRLSCAVFDVALLGGAPVAAPPYDALGFHSAPRGLSTLARKVLAAGEEGCPPPRS